MKPTLLLVDDDKNFASDFILLMENDFFCITSNNSYDGLNMFHEKSPDVVLLDLMLNDGTSGLDFLRKIMAEDENLPVIMITDYASTSTAVDAIKLGALDYITKTPNLDKLKALVERSLKMKLRNIHSKYLEESINLPYQKIIGESEAIKKLKEQIYLYSQNNHTVLITGDSGVGKELVARQIHFLGNRKNKPFVAINCSAIPKNLIESELFGHEKGAFTGAVSKKLGKFEIASEGTIFLDEISELDPDSQVKILRVLQEKEFDRVGGFASIKTNTRIIAASNKNLKNEVLRKNFREDLFYRLDVLPINVPLLKERREDIPILAEYFLRLAEIELKKKDLMFSEEALTKMTNYDWPGNVRELKNVVIHSALLSNGKEINSAILRIESPQPQTNIIVPNTWEEMDLLRKEAVEEASRKVEKVFVENLLKKFDGNITKAAEHIGISRISLHKMIRKCFPHQTETE
ncbi:MAG: sigma-54-dependent Fis family transcriptional regulator [Melioribacteraceae bacterium]|nr:sigma-54-dependent Fis family transcriptional regulator [Melioribacteraceae bacterium]